MSQIILVVGLVEFDFGCLCTIWPNFVLLDWNLAEFVVQVDNVVEHPNQRQPDQNQVSDQTVPWCHINLKAFQDRLTEVDGDKVVLVE